MQAVHSSPSHSPFEFLRVPLTASLRFHEKITMTKSQTLYEQIADRLESAGVLATLDLLETHFRREKDFFRLFEILKLRGRHTIGLPIIPETSTDCLSPKQQKELDACLLEACETVGTLFFREGNLEHGWAYLHPVGNRKLNESLVREVQVDDQNIDLLIEIALNQGAAPVYGYELTLAHHGTCNGVTAFGVHGPQLGRETKAKMASRLLRHVYGEVLQGVRRDIETQNQSAQPNANLRELLTEHRWLVDQQMHHLDATHLSSLMTIARLTTSAEDHQIALQLAEYGAGLPEDLQYSSSPPFNNTYPDHQLFFNALLGNNVDAAVSHFKLKCAEVTENAGPQHATEANEILIDFLYRVDRVDEAITCAINGSLEPSLQTGLALDPTEMACSPNQFESVLAHFQQQDDLLGYSVALLKRNETTAAISD